MVCASHEAHVDKIRWVLASRENVYRDLAQAYDFDQVVYVSRFLNFGQNDARELDDLRACLHSLGTGSHAKVIFAGSNHVLASSSDSWQVVCESLEDLCNFYRASRGIEILVTRSPHLVCPAVKTDYLHRAMAALEGEGHFELYNGADWLSNCISLSELLDFVKWAFDD